MHQLLKCDKLQRPSTLIMSSFQTATTLSMATNRDTSASDRVTCDDSCNSCWAFLPDPVFLQCVSSYLSVGDLINMSLTCRSWWDKAQDDYLWKRLFRRDFKVSSSIGLRPGECTLQTFPRLTFVGVSHNLFNREE